ncbi:hypothetical protein FE251_00820 [Georgenia wutianyii]|uniref:Integral membrane bound transporter domain-containing protein n=1 Tax=Georgenia wutianyii TaxID=2585135 RepID=A0ABX5VID5_9MICO|nr:FUSC family protein [Georgenia wutianyii]QDB78076.1 hypothetical protein FE251_00820 [Georgenia wutianyii]
MSASSHVRGGASAQSGNTAAPRRPRGSPLLIVLMIIVVVPSVLLADSWGAGAAGIIGGLTGMFSLVAFLGGPLWPDLRVALILGPLLVVAAALPRLVAESSRPAAIALVVLLTFVAGLLPLIGPRFANAGMGLGMTTMFGYGYAPMGGADHEQIIAAAVAGVVVALVLRVLMGISDPSKPTREQVAAVLVAEDPASAAAGAFGTWLADRRQRWLADALEGGSRYRLAVRAAELSGRADPDAVAALRARAEDLAGRIKAKPARAKADTPSPDPARSPAAEPADGPLADAARALDTVEQAVDGRDTTPVHLDRDRGEQLKEAVLHPSARLRSVQVRHAFRTALAVLLMLLVTSRLDRGDPLVSTALLATFSILQATWSETAAKTRNKIVGVVAGSLTVAVVLLLVPSDYLVMVATVSLCLGLWYVVTRPALGSAFMVVVSVGFNSVSRDLDPVNLLLQYVGLTACAVLLGVVLGYVVIPGFRPPPLRERVEAATAATVAALRASATGTASRRPEDITVLRDAERLQDELVPDRDRLDSRQLADLDTLRTRLRNLTVLADATELTSEDVDLVTAELARHSPADDAAGPSGTASTVLWDLAHEAGAAERSLLASLPAEGR